MFFILGSKLSVRKTLLFQHSNLLDFFEAFAILSRAERHNKIEIKCFLFDRRKQYLQNGVKNEKKAWLAH